MSASQSGTERVLGDVFSSETYCTLVQVLEHAPEPIDRTDGWLGHALDCTGHSRLRTYQLISKHRSRQRAETVLKQTVVTNGLLHDVHGDLQRLLVPVEVASYVVTRCIVHLFLSVSVSVAVAFRFSLGSFLAFSLLQAPPPLSAPQADCRQDCRLCCRRCRRCLRLRCLRRCRRFRRRCVASTYCQTLCERRREPRDEAGRWP